MNWPYNPKCGESCPLYPRTCRKDRAEHFFCTVDCEYNGEDVSGATFVIRKRIFTSCSIDPDKDAIPVDSNELPKSVIEKIPIRGQDNKE